VVCQHRAGLYPRPRAGMPDLRVDRIGEVDGRGPFGELDDVAPGSEDEDLAGEQVEAEGVQELPVVLGLAELQHPAHPGRLLVGALVALRVLLVAPGGRDAPLARAVRVAC